MWWAISSILVAVLVAVWLWLKQQKVKAAWYSLVLSIIGMLLLIYSIDNFAAFRAEHETLAALSSLLIFGTPGAILLFVAVINVWIRHHRISRTKSILEHYPRLSVPKP